MKEILSVPPRGVVDYYIDVFVEICYTFRIKDPNSQQAATGHHSSTHQQAEALVSSKEWLIECLQIIPINVFTADEKQRMIIKFVDTDTDKRFMESEVQIIYQRSKNHRNR